MKDSLVVFTKYLLLILLKEYFFEKSSVTLGRHMFICTKVSSDKAAVPAFTEKIPKRKETNSVPSVDVK